MSNVSFFVLLVIQNNPFYFEKKNSRHGKNPLPFGYQSVHARISIRACTDFFRGCMFLKFDAHQILKELINLYYRHICGLV